MNHEDKLRAAVQDFLKKTEEAAALGAQERKADAAVDLAKVKLRGTIKASGKRAVRYGRHQFAVGAVGKEPDALVWTQFDGVMLGPETADETPDHSDDCDCEDCDERQGRVAYEDIAGSGDDSI